VVADDRLDEAVGSVAEEAARLLETLRRQRTGSGPPQAAGDEEDERGADHEHEHEHAHVPMGEAAACTYCPLCRGIVRLRSVSPETLDRLAEVASAVAALLGDLAADRGGRDPAAPERRPRAEHIDVVDEED
jgi:hypothetical protein